MASYKMAVVRRMVIDGHVHMWHKICKTEEFLGKLSKTGVDGSIVISQPPVSFEKGYEYLSFEKRIHNLISFTDKRDLLFPFYFLDPTEENVFDQIDYAIDQGVMGFKAISTHYYPNADKAMRVWEYIAQHRKPLMLHTGILYNDRTSANFNRPGNFEDLFYIKDLRFSLAHVGWPWTDEMIAVFGKWNFYYEKNRNKTEKWADMYLDISPGTPPIYRKEVLQKLFQVGYSQMTDRVIWGTDNHVCYNSTKNKKLFISDYEMLSELLEKQEVKKIFSSNIMNFVGCV